MSEPHRLIEGEATEAERRLLSSWQSEQPSAAARAAVLGLVATSAAAAAASAAVPKAATGAWALGKWILIGALSGAATVAAFGLATPEEPRVEDRGGSTPALASVGTSPSRLEPREPPTPSVTMETPMPPPQVVTRGETPRAPILPVDRAPEAIPRPAIVAPAASPPADAPSSPVSAAEPTAAAPGVAPSSAPRSGLLAQVASLDRARAALAGGDAARALTLVDAHEAAFPNGALAQETTLLRIEALVRLGRRPQAERLGRAFLTAHPTSTHASKVRAIIEP